MGHNWIASAYDLRIVAAFVEHAHIQSQHIGKKDGAGHTSLIRADNHHMITVNLKLFLML